jgi:hypothetical protein
VGADQAPEGADVRGELEHHAGQLLVRGGRGGGCAPAPSAITAAPAMDTHRIRRVHEAHGEGWRRSSRVYTSRERSPQPPRGHRVTAPSARSALCDVRPSGVLPRDPRRCAAPYLSCDTRIYVCRSVSLAVSGGVSVQRSARCTQDARRRIDASEPDTCVDCAYRAQPAVRLPDAHGGCGCARGKLDERMPRG